MRSSVFKRNPNAAVYIDGGDNNRNTVAEIVPILQAANIAQANGFFLNSTVFQYTSTEVAYGNAVGNALGGKHFVVDTSRNGLGPGQESWCNARDRALGTRRPRRPVRRWPTPSSGSSRSGSPMASASMVIRARGSHSSTMRSIWSAVPSGRSATCRRCGPGRAVRALTLRGIIRGNGDGTFGSNSPTLRAQMAALITRPLALELEKQWQ